MTAQPHVIGEGFRILLAQTGLAGFPAEAPHGGGVVAAIPDPVGPTADTITVLVLRVGVGQQVNASSQDWGAPLDALAAPVPVVGFDLEELDRSFGYEYPFGQEVLDDLLARARDGAVLVASWHATNPVTGGPFTDRSWRDVGSLLDDRTAAARAFWADFEAKMALLARFQDGDGGRFPRTPVVLRPFHEANGGFFWWGKPDRATYRRLWARLQTRAAEAGVHNVLWAYSFNLHTAGVRDPVRLVPARVDLAGLDSYDPERPSRRASARDGSPPTVSAWPGTPRSPPWTGSHGWRSPRSARTGVTGRGTPG